MKSIIAITVIAFLSMSVPAAAQSTADKAAHGVKTGTKKAWHGTKKGANKAWHGTKKGANKAWHGTKTGAKKVGNETAELATEGKAKVTDKKSSEWTGPEGQTIYVDNGNKYYWVNGHGKRIYVSQSALRARNKN
ncbi:MAG: hypothetical protein ABIW38_06905 [Ferruginibacter sp.]